ncbi:unnamed protein product [Eruca vesicaria subsp. sativa]|uniref:Uncharacterized protein n=1 Tax=Eruca vesicaria subsp. sativa TaxID=29727 RepID=A0ABC8M513_ERUVS|nr:unnamed protein product [Eruca vesicaria subsp. sativa]
MTVLMLPELQVDELKVAKATPKEKALNFVCAMFKNPQAVLQDSWHMKVEEKKRLQVTLQSACQLHEYANEHYQSVGVSKYAQLLNEQYGMMHFIILFYHQ